MLSRLKNNYQFYILCLFCAIFVAIKIPNLNCPFFWDESWVYAPAIKTMAQNGISLFPNALSDSFSRGHPLLFFCTGALWVKLLDGSTFSLHLFGLIIAMSFIFTLFYIIKKLFDSTLALIVTTITLVQPNFIAQSTFALPEIFLALWAILTIYHFVVNNKYYYLLFGTLLMLTKESGVVIIASLMLYLAICFLTQKITKASFKLFIKNSLFAFIPIIPFIVFLVIQHYQKGYYLYPGHMALLNFGWKDFQEMIKHCYSIVFEEQGRFILTFSFLVIFAFLYKPIPAFMRWIIVIGLIASVKIFFKFWPLPDWLMVSFIGIFTCLFYYSMHIKYVSTKKEGEKLLAIIFITGLLYPIFSAVNFFTNRYLILLMPLMIWYFSYYIKESLQFRRILPYTWAAIIASVTIYIVITDCNSTGDDSPKYIHAVKLEQMVVKYMEQQNLQKANIYSNFNITVALQDKNSGYLTGNAIFSNITGTIDKNTDYVIYTNIDYDPIWQNGCDTLSNFHIVKTFDYGIAHGKIFKRI